MADFEPAVEIVLEHEGGFSMSPRDLGGVTNWGITQTAYSHYLKRHVSLMEMKDMTKEDAKEVYRTMYWDYQRLSEIKHQPLANIVFDLSVLLGPHEVTYALQRALKIPKPDGVLGSHTIEVCNTCDLSNAGYYLIELCQETISKIVVNRSDQRFYLQGWIKRTNDLLRLYYSVPDLVTKKPKTVSNRLP